MPYYTVYATIHYEAQCVIEANDPDHAVAIATHLTGIQYDELGLTNGQEVSVDEIVECASGESPSATYYEILNDLVSQPYPVVEPLET
jgi:hypothetical protein